MAEAATKAIAKLQREREKLVEELLRLRKLYEPHEPRDKEIRALLIKQAEDAGESFKITIPGLGKASISMPKPTRCEGTAPELVIEAFLRLPDKQRDKLIEKGLVVIAEQWKDAYSGRVYPELF